MITLTFDKGYVSERSIMINSYHERPLNNSFSGSFSAIIEKPEDVPEFPDFGENTDFSTIEAVNGSGVALPLHGHYNRVVDCSAAYDDTSKRYNVNIALGYAAEVQDE